MGGAASFKTVDQPGNQDSTRHLLTPPLVNLDKRANPYLSFVVVWGCGYRVSGSAQQER